MFLCTQSFYSLLGKQTKLNVSVAHVVEYHNNQSVHLVLVIPAIQNMQVIFEMTIDIYYE